MSFFIKSKQLNGKRNTAPKKPTKRKLESKHSKSSKNEEITSSEDEQPEDNETVGLTDSEDENETAQEKKIRLAKVYLEEIEKEEKARLAKDEVDQAVISRRLKHDYLKETGKLRTSVADKYTDISYDNIRTLKCKKQKNCLTSICISTDNQTVFCGSKDGIVIKYSLNTFKTLGIIPFVRSEDGREVTGNKSEILSLALSTDNTFLAVGDKLGNVNIWTPNTLKHVKTLTGHKFAILGLSFKKDSHTLYSSSKDKSVKVWNLDEMAYVETLFGHQDMVTSIDSLYRDRVVTSGSRDIRVWKITEETQLIYNGHVGNIDNVRLINEEHFMTGGDDGMICVWSIMRKKPLLCIENAHGKEEVNEQPRWITALGALTNTDLIASGSYDGFVRLWKLQDNFKKAVEILKVEVKGVVNALSFTSDGLKLLVCVSRDYRLGRWITDTKAKNVTLVIPFVIPP